MANCWRCGRNETNIDDGLTIKVREGQNRMMCEDVDDCTYHVQDEEIPEDTPCLEDPWWVYR
jgi:hypothetical protein